MLRSLRKGRSSPYFRHKDTGHSIGADNFESDVTDGTAVFRFVLKPVDGNQREDESYLHEEELVSVTIDDDRVIDGFVSHVEASQKKVSKWYLEIVSRKKRLAYAVRPDLEDQEGVRTLEFQVIPEHG